MNDKCTCNMDILFCIQKMGIGNCLFDTKQILPIGILIKAMKLGVHNIQRPRATNNENRHAIMVIMGNFCEVNDEQTI